MELSGKFSKALAEIKLKTDNNEIEASGISMLPVINNGDILTVEKREQYVAGDIVVALDILDRLLVHRVRKVGTNRLYIKGDNAIATEIVKLNDCLGRVVKVRKNIEKAELESKIYIHDDSESKAILNKIAYIKRYSLAKELFEKLNMLDFPYVSVKGVTIAKRAYNDETYRKSGDIDLLVSRGNASGIEKILKELGFIQGYLNREGELTEYSREDKVFYKVNTHQTAPFIKATGDKIVPYICVDVNFDILWGENKDKEIDIDDFISDYEYFSYQDVRFKALTLEKNLIHFCLHCYKDMNSVYLLSESNYFPAKSLIDIYGYYQRNLADFDWITFNSLIKALNVEKYIYYIFYYTSLLFNDDNILKSLAYKPESLDYLNQFGLLDNEIREWPVSFFERVLTNDIFNIIKPCLTEKELNKIKYNKKYL